MSSEMRHVHCIHGIIRVGANRVKRSKADGEIGRVSQPGLKQQCVSPQGDGARLRDCDREPSARRVVE